MGNYLISKAKNKLSQKKENWNFPVEYNLDVVSKTHKREKQKFVPGGLIYYTKLPWFNFMGT